MAYTNIWSEIVPTDNDLANSIDDLFRTGKIDLRERMNVIFDDWAADPVVPKQSAFGAKEGKKLIIHGTAFQRDVGTIDYNDAGITSNSSTEPLRAPLVLPTGVTITGTRWLITNGDTTLTALKLVRMVFDAGVAAEIVSDASSSLVGTNVVETVFSHTVSANYAYFLKADRAGGSEFSVHAVEITYNTPDSRATI